MMEMGENPERKSEKVNKITTHSVYLPSPHQ